MAKKGPTRSGTPLKKISEEKINFQSVFTNFCSQVTEKTPIVRVLTQPLKPGQEWKTYPASITKIKDYFEVFIQNENCEKSGMVHKVLVRNEDLDYRILDALNNTINQYDTVTVLR